MVVLTILCGGRESLIEQLMMSNRSLPLQVNKDEEKTVLQD